MEDQLLLTGGTGFFGRSLLRHYLAHRREFRFGIVVPNRDPERFQSGYSELYACDGLTLHKADIQIRASLPCQKSLSHVLYVVTDSTLGPSLYPLQRWNVPQREIVH